MARTTNAEIKGMLKRLNQNTKEEYHIQNQLGGGMIEYYANESGAVNTIGHRVKKSEMYSQLYAINELLEHESKNPKPVKQNYGSTNEKE